MVSRRVVLICGPPGAGKSTKARTLGLTVYDRDDSQWHSERAFTQALIDIGNDDNAQAVVIRAGATESARLLAAKQVDATQTIIMPTDKATCRARIIARASAVPIATQLAALNQWWATYEPASNHSREW